MKRYFYLVFALFIFSKVDVAMAANDAPSCPINAKAEIVHTMENMYSFAKVDDIVGFRSLISPDFYAYDLGEMYTGDSLMELIIKVHASGVKLEWQVTSPDVHVDCKHAWLAYRNVGSVEKDQVKTPLEWLESAELAYINGKWLIQFFHSSQVPKKP